MDGPACRTRAPAKSARNRRAPPARVGSSRGTPLDSLNYHHLLYFWTVAREGGLAPAGRVLRLSHPTLSAQMHSLEDRLGEKLFVKQGRRLILTEMGRVVYRYAEEIFTLGRGLVDTVHGRATGKPLRLTVGVVDALPKLVVAHLLEPALRLEQPVRLVCREASFDRLLAALAEHALDLVLSDAPVPPGYPVRAFHYLLGECGVTFFGTSALAAAYASDFPASLEGAPVLLPLPDLSLRRSLDEWFSRVGVRPRVVAEFEDSALLKVFGSEGRGLFPAPTVVERAVSTQHGVEVVGRADAVRERFYAISVERRLENPAAVAISEAARHGVFARPE